MDPYGFERPADFDYTTYEEFFSRYLVVLTRRAIKWSKLLKGNTRVQKNIKGKTCLNMKLGQIVFILTCKLLSFSEGIL